MALGYLHPRAPGAGPHYVFIEQAYPLRNTGAVVWRADIYGSEGARERFIASDAALITLHKQIVEIERETQKAKKEFSEKVAISKSGKEKDDLCAASARFVMSQNQKIDALKMQQVEHTAIFQANRPFLTEAGEIPPGVLEVREDGTVPVGEVYEVLAKTSYPGAVRVD